MLTPLVLVQRVRDVFPGTYLTVLAIIHGVALGLLLTIAQQQWIDHSDAVERVMITTQAVAAFVAIIVVTHRYLLLTVLTRWMPTVLDTILPYALGVGEIGTALLLGKAVAWWIGALVFSLAGVGAFAYSRMRVSIIVFGKVDQLYNQFRRITLLAIISLSVLAMTCIVMIILGANTLQPNWLYALMPLIVAVTAAAIEVYGNYRFAVGG